MHQEGEGLAGPFRSAVADVYAEADGTVVVRFRPEARVTLDSAREVVAAHVAAARGRRCPALVDLRGMRAADVEGRRLAAGPEIAAVTSQMALIVGDPLSRILGNFFLRVSRPLYPTRIFTAEASARRWLSEESAQ